MLTAEKVEHEADALPVIARAASGSMRDALSLLDQAIAHGGGRVTAAGVGEMLGTIDQSYLVRLVECVAAGDAAGAAGIAGDMQARSLSFDGALSDLAGLLLRVALVQSAPEAVDDAAERARIAELAARLDPESVQLYYQIAVQGREDLPLAPDEHAGFLMTVLRMLAFRPEGRGRQAAACREASSPRCEAPAAESGGRRRLAGAGWAAAACRRRTRARAQRRAAPP